MQTLLPYLSRALDVVEPDTPIRELASRFSTRPHEHLVVCGTAGLVGVVRAASVVAGLDRPALTAEDLLSGALVMAESARLEDALEALAGDPEDIVVVVDASNEPVGVLTEQDGLHLAARLLPSSLNAGSFATHGVKTIAMDALATTARQRMRDEEIRHLIVVDATGPRSVVSERDLLAHGVVSSPELTVAEVIGDRPLVTADPDESLASLAERMHTDRIGCLPLSHEGHLTGIVTRTDAIRALLASLHG